VTTNWREDALCRQVGGDWWYPEKGGDKGAPAKQICAQCPVTAECLEWALENRERYGVWGGVSERERRRLLRSRVREAA
jgi:WhiB family transcriptional regulator, redox-sensing transcriptional regulator